MKYIVITGGVISGLGKGITASSIGLLLKEKNYNVTAIKIDPYLNIDAGTMSPYEHGEVYVLNDGTETDLDLGNYERFLNIHLSKSHNITSGKVFKRVLEDERKGKYMGQTVQYIPHVTNTIIDMIKEASGIYISKSSPDICIIELGGTVGDMENLHFIEALRQMRSSNLDMCFVHVSLLVNMGEEKTKPTQQCVQELRRLGISPDLLVLRSQTLMSEKTRQKLHLHCQVLETHIFTNPDVNHIYEVPGVLQKQSLIECIEDTLKLPRRREPVLFTMPMSHFKEEAHIAVVGKYTENRDTYLSIHRALEQGAFANNMLVNITYLSSEESQDLEEYDGVVIPGGFGNRGIEGMIQVATYCREHNKPLLGICLGMQIMCIAAVRKLYPYCSSSEFDPDGMHNVVVSIDELDFTKMGGTMKLGIKETRITNKNSHAYQMYKSLFVYERHRHRYEVNPEARILLEQEGLEITGLDMNNCIDIIEDPNNRFYFGCQYHPEYMNSLKEPSKVFTYFVNKCKRLSDS